MHSKHIFKGRAALAVDTPYIRAKWLELTGPNMDWAPKYGQTTFKTPGSITYSMNRVQTSTQDSLKVEAEAILIGW